MFIKYDYTADGKPIMVEVTEEVAEFLREDKRVTGNADRRERDHCEFHMDAMDYEGEAFAYRETPEQILLRKERDMALWKAMEVLSNTQFRRLILFIPRNCRPGRQGFLQHCRVHQCRKEKSTEFSVTIPPQNGSQISVL